MKLKIFLALIFAIAASAASVYVYTLVDPRLEIILLKNEEILQLDNKIAELTEKNADLTEQVSSIASTVKTNESDSGKINDEYKVCLRNSKRLKTNVRKLTTELSALKSKNKILQEYVQVKNEVTSLKEQIASMNQEKGELSDLVETLGPATEIHMDAEGAVVPETGSPDAENSGIPPIQQ